MADALDGRCGTCARFVRVVESIAATGEVTRSGDCLLGVWPSPLYETSTCSQWIRRGQFKARPPEARRSARSARSTEGRERPAHPTSSEPRHSAPGLPRSPTPAPLTLPEDLLDMDADEFRKVLSEVIRTELGVVPVEMAGKWDGGEMVLKPGKPGLQEKHVPIDALFHKIVMIRDRLRVLEQKVNSSRMAEDEKVQIQQYVTACYGSLTTFNVLFANREDQFVGQKGDE